MPGLRDGGGKGEGGREKRGVTSDERGVYPLRSGGKGGRWAIF